VCFSAIKDVDIFLNKYFQEVDTSLSRARIRFKNYYIYSKSVWVADWPFKVAGLFALERFIKNRDDKVVIMRTVKDLYDNNRENPDRDVFEILAAHGLVGITAKDFKFQSKALKFFKTEFIDNYLNDLKKGRYRQFILGKTSGADLEGLSGTAMWMVDYCTRNNIGMGDHAKIERMMEIIPGGLGNEIPMFHHTHLSDVAGDPNYSFEDKIRAWNAKSDIFTLRYDKATNTLEIGDFKPDLDFDSKNPGEHFANAIMQVLVYALTVQKEVGGEVNIRCLIFNKNGFIQFEPNSMYFELLNFMTNLKGSEWHYHIRAEVASSPDQKIRKAYKKFYNKIMPSLDAMKFFIDFYGTVDTSVLYSDVSDQSYYTYLKYSYLRAAESKIGEMQRLVQNDYLDTLEQNHPDLFG
jgi:hypothetical protein